MGCGQAVRRLALDEEILGSNPSIPAIEIIFNRQSIEWCRINL